SNSLCTKSGKSDLFSLRPLRISAALCVERPINAENAEIRRGPQRKELAHSKIHVISPVRFDGLDNRTRFAQKVANLICFLCGPLRISAALCVERLINAENAEIRRGPQRKE